MLFSQKQAQKYHDAGNTLTYNPELGVSSEQLGPGAYISPIRADWPMSDSNWDCAILADSTAWNLVNKAWVPETADDGCTPLWYNKGKPNRDAYLSGIGGPGFTTSNTVLLSQIHQFEKLQILIPSSLMGKSGGLNLNVQCAAKTNQQGIGEISVYGDVDWYSWTNVKGTPQYVNPS
ncbi:uncharacterized protein GGS22DRAFT_110619 [Annulohypoxylon maeteangense]|uniref:uncharacterized protein n=1 Tax=Annulohypoxylon maeteangense TaxID=1927788 RepID=UPI0020075AF7|nr:uncharacterized protein GGS22DRAFT_110619 [Annulohypoxylon maeteangense]KAI0887521.1 hypothetical protein GGS22DRAFT_110619 [Annulohypoxylon maeteangense]